MLVVTSENFEQEVLNAQGPVLVDFFASGACHVKCLHRFWRTHRNNLEAE